MEGTEQRVDNLRGPSDNSIEFTIELCPVVVDNNVLDLSHHEAQVNKSKNLSLGMGKTHERLRHLLGV